MDKERLLKETIVLLAADIYQNVFDYYECFFEATSKIIELAEEFENNLNWKENDERDYMDELDKFEKKVLEKYRSEKGAATSQ